jgi:chromosome segregation ATPase
MPEQFVNVFKANKHIVALDAQIATLTAERDMARTELATAQAAVAAHDPTIEATAAQLQADLTAAQASLTQAQADLVTAKQSISTLTTERDGLQAKVAALPTQVSQQAANITAAQGQPPIAVTPATGTGSGAANTMKRADFDALQPSERSKFIRSGGRLTD